MWFLFNSNPEISAGRRMRSREPTQRTKLRLGWMWKSWNFNLWMCMFSIGIVIFCSTPTQKLPQVGGWETEDNPENHDELGLDVKELELNFRNNKETKQISETQRNSGEREIIPCTSAYDSSPLLLLRRHNVSPFLFLIKCANTWTQPGRFKSRNTADQGKSVSHREALSRTNNKKRNPRSKLEGPPEHLKIL